MSGAEEAVRTGSESARGLNFRELGFVEKGEKRCHTLAVLPMQKKAHRNRVADVARAQKVHRLMFVYWLFRKN